MGQLDENGMLALRAMQALKEKDSRGRDIPVPLIIEKAACLAGVDEASDPKFSESIGDRL